MNYTDQMMREIRLNQLPSRIVSLVPSITELLADLGLAEQIAGITKFCIHPESVFRTKKHIGGTKKVDHDKINKINPDLIIANKEENTKEDIEILAQKYPVWISDIQSLEDAMKMIDQLGKITGKKPEAHSINSVISEQFQLITPLPLVSTLYMIWRNPYMVAGKATFINDMMQRCGFVNALNDDSRYPALTGSDLVKLNPELILLSSEPYPFKEKHIVEINEIIPGCRIELVDGEYFSWYGSRLTGSPAYFNTLINKLNNRNPAASFYEN